MLLEEISSGATNAVKGVQNAGKISENACLQKYFAGDPKFQICQFSKKYFSIASLSEENRELGFTLQGMLQRKSRNISVVVVTDFQWLIQSPDEVQTFGT